MSIITFFCLMIGFPSIFAFLCHSFNFLLVTNLISKHRSQMDTPYRGVGCLSTIIPLPTRCDVTARL